VISMPEKTDELLPCPFCGGNARIAWGCFARVASADCMRCGATGPEVAAPKGERSQSETIRLAAESWNRRAAEAQLRQDLADVDAAAYQMQIAIACYLHVQVARGGVGRISVSKHDLIDWPDVLKGELETWSDHDEIVLRLKPADACKAVKP